VHPSLGVSRYWLANELGFRAYDNLVTATASARAEVQVQKRPRRADKLKNIPVDRLERSRLQPRRAIDGMALKKLAESVQAEGVIQPLLVRKLGGGRFEIVAGERRWHAARMAGLKRVPTIVRNVSDLGMIALALVENLHREDLNPIDQARAARRLVESFAMTHQEIADMIGRSRVSVTNLLRLLELPDDVQAMLADGKLDVGHARALLALPEEQRLVAAEEAVTSRMSVRDVEQLAKEPGREAWRPGSRQADSASAWFERYLSQAGQGIRLKPRRDRGWSLNIAFEDLEQLRHVLETLGEILERLERTEARTASGLG
jgi:ParB family chromosome partitioning protein